MAQAVGRFGREPEAQRIPILVRLDVFPDPRNDALGLLGKGAHLFLGEGALHITAPGRQVLVGNARAGHIGHRLGFAGGCLCGRQVGVQDMVAHHCGVEIAQVLVRQDFEEAEGARAVLAIEGKHGGRIAAALPHEGHKALEGGIAHRRVRQGRAHLFLGGETAHIGHTDAVFAAQASRILGYLFVRKGWQIVFASGRRDVEVEVEAFACLVRQS